VITGKHYYDTFTFNNNVRKFKRIEELSSILYKFKLVISRAGGATITELLLANVVFILIPSGNVVGNHQVLNANYIKSMGACEVIDDIKDLKYLSNIYDLIFNQERRNNILLKQKDIVVTDSITRIKKLINKL
jgi:UDP-N-acetylglucosamine--N-acetylmuramyl-(pentapeptide) pyrophosphoryl-undecaprenol N-acetylglucosamine transferase